MNLTFDKTTDRHLSDEDKADIKAGILEALETADPCHVAHKPDLLTYVFAVSVSGKRLRRGAPEYLPEWLVQSVGWREASRQYVEAILRAN
jgi:hypothetical protein